MSEPIEHFEVGSRDVMDGEEEPNGREEVLGIDPELEFRTDKGFLNIVEFFSEGVFEI